MVEDYVNDRDQEEALRAWWRENWRWILGGVALGLALLFGWRYFENYREQRALTAAQKYSEIEAALTADNTDKAAQLLNGMTSDFASSAYALEARLLVAKSYVDDGKYDDAVPLLRAVMDGSKDEQIAQIARLRLARVLLQQGKHDETLQLLDPQKAGEFAGAVREVRGDAFYAKGDIEAARAEYAAALTGNDAQLERSLVELKLQEVGGVAPAAGKPETLSAAEE